MELVNALVVSLGVISWLKWLNALTMDRKFAILGLLVCAIYLPANSFAQQQALSSYWLFGPVPKAQMREMETDRPDVTESPYTVDAGHFQYETDLVGMTRERSDHKQSNTLLINQFNLKIGITGSTAIQIGFQSYGKQKQKDLASGERRVTAGIGDVTFRVKQNLLGNDGGNFALAVLPYVKFPSSKYDDQSRFEGGVIVPMQFKLPGDWKLGIQVEATGLRMRRAAADAYGVSAICHHQSCVD